MLTVGQEFNPVGIFTFAAIPEVVCRMKGINSSAKLLYGQLVRYRSMGGGVYPGQETLAEDLGMSRTNVRDSIEQLVGAQLILVIEPKGKEKIKGFNNSYKFLLTKEMIDSMKDQGWEGTRPVATSSHGDGYAGGVMATSSHADGLLVDHPSTKTIVKENTLSVGKPPTDRRWTKLAKILCHAIQTVRNVKCDKSVPSWAKDFERLSRVKGVEYPRMKKVLRWYCTNLPLRHKDKFFLVIHSASAFYEKFERLESMIERDATEASDSGQGPGGPPAPIKVTFRESGPDTLESLTKTKKLLGDLEFEDVYGLDGHYWRNSGKKPPEGFFDTFFPGHPS